MIKLKKFVAYILVVGVLSGAVFAVLNIRDIMDWWKLRSYKPSQSIVQLADNAKMSDLGRKYFYVHDPIILNKAEFQSSCTVGEATIVLGCYVANDRIYLYDVQDDRLIGVEEVTAAHEMLHAAYDRLSPKEKSDVNVLLQDAYDRLNDDRIRKNVASYESRDPNVVMNELHSIIGTEVLELPKDLESYYSRYFTNRLVVVSLAQIYANEFEKREAQIAAYDAQLSSINGEITRRQAELGITSQALAEERKLLESLRSDPSAFNQGVRVYNNKVNSYNAEVAKTKTLIDQYNEIVTKRNEIAVEERQLVEAIDTRVEKFQ
jgi:hypothetical protein